MSGSSRLLKSGLKPVLATEIEFYLHGAGSKFSPEQVIALIHKESDNAGILLASVEQERGPDQYEVALLPSDNIKKITSDTERFKALMIDVFTLHLIRADFSAKPMADAPGSGLHVHVHLEDNEGKNVFFREEDEGEFSPLLLNAIGGLLVLMNPFMSVFAPYERSYTRFIAGSNVPTTVSWGTNNRTVAVRLPAKPLDHKHLEHRVAGSDANVHKVVDAILTGIEYGIAHQCNPGEPIYGDASLAQYNLPKLARSLEEALALKAEYANKAS